MFTAAQHYSFSALITAIANLLLMIAVFHKSKDRTLAKRFAIYTYTISHWSFFVFWCTSINDEKISYFLAQICHLGGIFVPITFLHFVLVYTKQKTKPLKNFLYFNYFFAFMIGFVILFYPGYFIASVTPKLTFNFFPNPGPLFIIWNIQLAILVLTGFLVLTRKALALKGPEQKSIAAFILANLVGYTGTIGCFFPVYNITAFPFPYGIWGAFFFICATAFAVMRYKWLDIDVIVRRATVFAGLFGFVYGLFALFTFIGQRIFLDVLGWNIWFSMVPTIAVVIFALRPLEEFLVNLTDRYLFQKKYDYRDLLQAFTTEVLSILDLNSVATNTTQSLTKIIKLESCSVYLKVDDNESHYQLVSTTSKSKYLLREIPENNMIVYNLSTHHKHVLFSSADVGVDLKNNLSLLDAELCLPIKFKEELIGVISLGSKKSGEIYSQPDIDILSALSRTVGIAVSNAKLFNQLSTMQAEAAQNEKMAVIGTLAAGINHEICNPLGIVRGQCEVFLLNLRDGLFDQLPEKEVVAQAAKTFDKIIKETDRATGITKRLSTFAKPSKEFKLSEVDITNEIDEVMSILGHEMKVDNINLIKSIPSNFPKIYADRKQIQEVVFNIIRNGAQAIDGKGSITIAGEENGDKAIITISDTGHGIAADKIEKIFNPFFTTKDPGKGTGLGLFIVKQIVERNFGTIQVNSEVGVGTKFILSFSKSGPQKIELEKKGAEVINN